MQNVSDTQSDQSCLIYEPIISRKQQSLSCYLEKCDIISSVTGSEEINFGNSMVGIITLDLEITAMFLASIPIV